MQLGNTAAWLLLMVAGLFEVAWVIGLKYTDGFTRLIPSLLTAVAVIVSMLLLGLSARTLPIGTAYAVWTGIGTVGAVLLGILLFGDSANTLRLICIAFVLAGIIGLRLVGR